MKENKQDPVVEIEELDEELDECEEEDEEEVPLGVRLRAALPKVAIYLRYFLPLLALLVLFVMSFFHNVWAYIMGVDSELSIARLYVNTFKGVHEYLGGKTTSGQNSYYGLMTAGAVIGILCFLAALFLKGLAAYSAVRAFRAGHESEESDKAKLIFKIAFPNRKWLFLSDLLILLPVLYPNFCSFLGSARVAAGGVETVSVTLNRPLIVGAIFLLLTLVLALLIPKHERRQKMNMFLLHRNEEPKASEDEEEPDEEDVYEENE